MGTLIPTVLPQINHYSLLYLDSKSLTTSISRVCVTYIIVGVSLVFLCQLRSFGSSEAEEQSELTLLNLVAQNLQLTCALELLQLFICQLLHKQLYISLSHWENPGWLYSYNILALACTILCMFVCTVLTLIWLVIPSFKTMQASQENYGRKRTDAFFVFNLEK